MDLFLLLSPNGQIELSSSQFEGTAGMQSLFERYGGIRRISGLVLRFYDRVLGSERLAPYFAGCDMRRLVEHQASYISTVMGGPASYSAGELRAIHASHGISEGDFDEMLSHFRAAMEADGFATEDIDDVMARLARLRGVIVSA